MMGLRVKPCTTIIETYLEKKLFFAYHWFFFRRKKKISRNLQTDLKPITVNYHQIMDNLRRKTVAEQLCAGTCTDIMAFC